MYRDHLLCVHGQVSRREVDTTVSLDDRELAIVRASVSRRQVSGPVRAACRRVELGLPRVSDRETERRLKDNLRHTERRHRAAARARGEALATLRGPGTPLTNNNGDQSISTERIVTLSRSSQYVPRSEPVL